VGDSHLRDGASVEQFLVREVSQLNEDIGMLFCIIPDKGNSAFLYPAIKRWSHTISGIPTQCLQGPKALGKLLTNPQYKAGVLLKMNLKLGGHNVYMAQPLSIMNDKPTMIMGMDVNHPQPGSDAPSYSALCASLDREVATYHTQVWAQKARREIVTDAAEQPLGEKIRISLRKYKEANSVPPKSIIFFRDGVAHNQLDDVETHELSVIKQACALEGGEAYNPFITLVVVQQRTRARFAVERNHSFENVPSGTVIDKDVIDNAEKDFFLVAQKGIKGTCRPCHFHLVYTDDPSCDVLSLQKLTYELCSLYARATKTVSRPAPVYYAHRAAMLAQYYKGNFKEANDAWETGSMASALSTGSSDSAIPPIHLCEQVANKVYFA